MVSPMRASARPTLILEQPIAATTETAAPLRAKRSVSVRPRSLPLRQRFTVKM